MKALTPLVRAPWAKSSVHSLLVLPEAERTRALAQVKRQTIDQIEETFRLAWIEVRHLVEIDEAIRAAMGGPEYLAHCRRSIRRAFDWPLLAPIVSRAFGGGPAAFLQALPRGYQAVTRHAGVLRTQLERDGASITAAGLPPIVRESDSFLAGIHGAILACLDMARRPVPVEEDRTRLAEGLLRYRVRFGE